MAKQITGRFIRCFELAKKRGIIRSAREFALAIGCHPQSMHEVLKGRRDVTVDMLEGAISHYNFSTKYIFHNQGNPRVGNTHQVMLLQDMPLVRADQFKSYVQSSDTHEFCQRLPHITFFGVDSEYSLRAFEISETNQELGIRSSDILICSLLEKESWKKEITDEEIYLVLYGEDLRVKMIRNMLSLREMIVLSSSFAVDAHKQLLSPNEVGEIWRIHKVITSHAQGRLKRWSQEQKINRIEDLLSQQGEVIAKLRQTLLTDNPKS